MERVELPPLVPETGTLVLDRNGVLLRPFAIADGRWRLPATLADVDPLYRRRRCSPMRTGDFARIAASTSARSPAPPSSSSRHGRPVSGASTLTMQVARLLKGDSTRSPFGKLDQMLTALALERALSKDQILELYLTLAPYGGNIEGVRAASLAYFGKEPRRLNPAEAALLVALPQAPEGRRPDRNAARAEAARNRVLARVVAAGILPEDDAAAARTEEVPAARRAVPMLAAHTAGRLVAEAPGRPVHRLTIEAGLQRRLEPLAAERAAALSDSVSVAILVADHKTGEILASVGSSGLFDERARRLHRHDARHPLAGLDPEAAHLRPRLRAGFRASGEPDRGPAGRLRRLHARQFRPRVPRHGEHPPRLAALAQRACHPASGGRRAGAARRRACAAPARRRCFPDLSPPGLAVGLGGVGVTLTDLVAIHAAIGRGGLSVPLTIEMDRPLAGLRSGAGAGRPRRLVRRLDPRRRAGAGACLARHDRLQDRHLLRLSRRLGDRLRRPPRRSASGSAAPTARRFPA